MGRIRPMALACGARRPEEWGARWPAGAAQPIGEAGPSGARLRAQRAQRRGHHVRCVPVARPLVMARTARCGVILRSNFSEWRRMRRARS
jgi:hypothetical protein